MRSMTYTTKEESNHAREQAFLALAPVDRLQWFLSSFGRRTVPEPKEDVRRASNAFVLERTPSI